jgi:hypothetical protein
MGRKSSLTQLAPEIRTELDRLLKEDKLTISQVVDHLRALGAPVSRAAVGRYHKNFEEVAKRMRQAREVAGVWAEKIGKEPESEVGRGLIEMMRTLCFDASADQLGSAETPDAKALFFLSSTLKNLEAAERASLETRLRARKAALEDASKKVDEMAKAKKAGLTPEMAEQIKREFLGIK